jgi:phosphatidylinositol glycan class N
MHRSVWSAVFVLIGLVWPVTAWPAGMMSKNRALTAAWMTSCLVSAVFPLLSVNKEESIPLM